MANTLVRVYSNMANAQQARTQLLDAGFSDDSVHLRSTEDEAGPVQSNFTVGNVHAGEDAHYGDDFRNVEQRGTCLLTVDASDGDQAARADEIMRRFGALDGSEGAEEPVKPPPRH